MNNLIQTKFSKGDVVITKSGIRGIVDHVVDITIKVPEGATEIGFCNYCCPTWRKGVESLELPLNYIEITYWIHREKAPSFPANELELKLDTNG